jgi:diaminohydroxyphosphoribosylaminopyrimidine deaminase/5-amino-6-(5-phosphoribosylamino)uracil reductase
VPFLARTRRDGRSRRPRALFDGAVADFFMRLALREAEKGLGRTRPNPAVGAVLVKNGRVIARGHHARAGGPHAEVVALRAAGARARGADLYTTLEPCDHWGQTPPCTRAIAEAGVKRVFVGSTDPNPKVNGRGIARLRALRIPVITGVLADACDRHNAPWRTFVRRRRPFVTLKAAITLDGKLAAAGGDARWVSGPESREEVHRQRDRVDAILVGAGTARADDPRLTSRPRGGRGHDPVRVVLDSRLSLPRTLKLFRQRSAAPTWVAHVAGPPGRGAKRRVEGGALRRAQGERVERIRCQARGGQVDLPDLLRKLAGRGITHLWVEGGAEVFGAFLAAQLVDRVVLFMAPKILGATGVSWVGGAVFRPRRAAQALQLGSVEVSRMGEDLMLTATPVYAGKARR